jgi:hypothetical protein
MKEFVRNVTLENTSSRPYLNSCYSRLTTIDCVGLDVLATVVTICFVSLEYNT